MPWVKSEVSKFYRKQECGKFKYEELLSVAVEAMLTANRGWRKAIPGALLDYVRTRDEFVKLELSEGEYRATIAQLDDLLAEARALNPPPCDIASDNPLVQEWIAAGKQTDRERIFDKFRAGEIRVICNVATLATGVDLPMVSCLIDARPTKSEIRFVQTIGRGLRTAPGKDRLIVLDHTGNALRLGLVTDIHHEGLDAGEPRKSDATAKERDKPLPRLCEDCSAVLPQSAKVCPECGKVREIRTDVDIGARPTKRGAGLIFTEQEDFYGELRWIATVRGYAPGWASQRFRERFGVWPNDWQVRLAAPREPGLKTKNWLKSRVIAYAKAREAVCG